MNQTEERLSFDAYADDGGYSPELYEYHEIATGVESFDTITDADVQRFHEQGFLPVEKAFTQTETRDALEGLMDLIEGKNP
ncbi:MAG: hypothetical protein O2954_10980, partial [bacterium]|nr:hypothetical protein [bacterium]